MVPSPPFRLRLPLWISTRRVTMHLPYSASPRFWISGVRLDCPKLNWESALRKNVVSPIQ